MKNLIYILFIFSLLACYEDKGNYDYKDVNTVEIGLEDLYSFRLDKDTTIMIIPKLSQSLSENKENLSFMWRHSTVNEFIEGHGECDTCGYSDTLYFHIDPNAEDLEYEHYFRLNIYDHLTDIDYPYNTKIKLVKPYDGAWMILHDEDGHAKLGSVEYMGTGTLKTQDAYNKDTGKSFSGKGQCLGFYYTGFKPYGYSSNNVFTVVTDNPEECGVMCQWNKFELMTPLSKLVYQPQQTSFNFSNVRLIDSEGSWGAICLTDNILYQSSNAMKLYKANVASEMGDNVKIKHATKSGFGSLLYDAGGHRFCFYLNQTREGTYDPKIFDPAAENPENFVIDLVPVRDNNVKEVDPNFLPIDQKVVGVVSGYNFTYGSVRDTYAYGIALKNQDSCFIYEFNMWGMVSTSLGDYPPFSNYYRLAYPEGMSENSCFAATMAYNGILYYTAGNVVYRLSFSQSGGKATPIYTHERGGNATVMKFARKAYWEDDADYTDYEFDPNYSLAIAFDLGNGKSDFVVLNLSTTGTIGADSEHYPATQIYTDFGEIKDILFL